MGGLLQPSASLPSLRTAPDLLGVRLAHPEIMERLQKPAVCVACFIQGDEYYDGDELFMHEETPFWCYKSM